MSVEEDRAFLNSVMEAIKTLSYLEFCAWLKKNLQEKDRR